MREKLVSKTYMRGVLDYEMVIINSKDKKYGICIKKINDISEPFDIFEFGKNITHIDNGYYIVEATLFDDYYNARVYLDDKMNIKTLKKLMSPDKTFVHMSGKVQTRDKFFNDISN